MELLRVMGKVPSGKRLERIQLSPHYRDGKFQNPVPTTTMKGGSFFKILKAFLSKRKDTAPPAPLPVLRTDLRALPDIIPVVVWFGHSSYLLKVNGQTILVDPVFSGHAAPVSFFARAFPGTNIYGVEDMPDIDWLVITHDHYDHLDYSTFRKLAPRVRHIYTSLGVGSHMAFWGIAEDRVTELDWGETAVIGDGTITATPARHFSGRGRGQARTLWSSFVLKLGGYSFFLGGDSGYGPHFSTIGQQYGPFDLAVLECGQYGRYWPDIHMLPEETVAAAEDLGAKMLLPVHWGKFSLALHPWDEPVRRVAQAAEAAGLAYATPMIGEPLLLGRSLPHKAWWEAVRILILVVSVFYSGQAFSQELKLTGLRCDQRVNPGGVENTAPRLSWEILSDRRGVTQTAYRVLVSEDSVRLSKNEGTVWDSKKVMSDASIRVAYKGSVLSPAKTYYWKVMIWDDHRDTSRWSETASWQMGLLKTADWKGAKWIGYEPFPDTSKLLPGAKGGNGPYRDSLPLLRKEFWVSKPLRKATAFVSGLGHFEMNLNGQKVGDHFLDAGWVRYDREAQYVPFDITQMLQQGANAVGVMLGNGFYYVPRERYHKLTVAFGYPKMIARIFLEYADGSTEDVVSDPLWQVSTGPLTFSSTYGGEDYDARREQKGWDMPGFKGKAWKAAVMVDGPPALHAQQQEPLKVFEHFTPRRQSQLRPGVWVYDLGQNASGIPMIRVKGDAGRKVRIVPAELLHGDTAANQDATGNPCYFDYTLKGEGVESWHPRFMYYGFRYLQIEGAIPAGQPNPDSLPVIVGLEGWHTRNAAERVGTFSCSNELFRRTDTLIDWAVQSNLASVLTDCPHREKLGWLEEAHLMGSSLRYNYNIATLYQKIIRDMMGAQTEAGLVPEIAPEFTQFSEPFRDSPEWGSSCIIVPWYGYQYYGDRESLEAAYPMMRRYNTYLTGKAEGYILYQGLGDWYDLGPEHPGVSQLTPKGLTATAIWYYDLTILSKVARMLGKAEEAKKYDKLAAVVKTAFNAKFFNRKTKQYGTGSQTANAMAVFAGLVLPADRKAVVDNIVADLRSRNNALTSGDIGFRYLLKVLADEGRADVIFDMNSRNDVPGYGFQLAHGATSLTESWQALPSVSNNHFMLGHIMEWFYTDLAGIRADEGAVAFRRIVLKPELVGDISTAQGGYRGPYGTISSQWKKEGQRFEWNIRIPANTTAVVYVPAASGEVVMEGGRPLQGRKDVRMLRREKGRLVLSVGSGSYDFSVKAGAIEK